MSHLGMWKKVQNVHRDPRVALSMLGPNTNAQGLRESLVVYGSARITEGGAPILLQRLARIYVGPDCEFPPPGVHSRPTSHTSLPHRSAESVPGSRADGDWCASVRGLLNKTQKWLTDTLVHSQLISGRSR
jgi:hypothetical protein